MLDIILLTVAMIPLLIIIKRFVMKHSEAVLKVNPYLQTFIGFIVLLVLFVLLVMCFGFNSVVRGVMYLLVFIVTVYIGCVFQEYYGKLNFD